MTDEESSPWCLTQLLMVLLMNVNIKKLLITGFEDLGKYSKESISVIDRNLVRNHKLAKSFGWAVCHYDEKHGVKGTSSFLCEEFPQIPKVKFHQQHGWAERSDFARILAMLEKKDLDYEVMAWLDADVFIIDPEQFFDRGYEEGLHAPEEPWFNQKEIESIEKFKKVKQEQTNSVLISSGKKGNTMLALMLEIMKFLGEYGEIGKRPWAQFGPKMLTRLNYLDYTVINDGKGAQIREKITGVFPEIGLIMTNTISIDKYIEKYGLPQLFTNANIENCNFVNMTPSSVKDIGGIYEKLLAISNEK